ncbi:FecCD family ABC transporter permease [Amycolatopsis anabasis]|uniref:FecCD family ABC transporter permease n=1 Tax=Amycolatopsis anabasis TaxID=1840409 RepID=UPI001C554593|nr:iron ABC transporter permease [Amycolatopsis anabasis]
MFMSRAGSPVRWWLGGLMCLFLLAVAASILFGSADYGPDAVLDYLFGGVTDATVGNDVSGQRVPRTIAGAAIGAALGISGAILQAVTRNPLAESGLLGVNAGAALGVVCGFTFAGATGSWTYLVWAFAGAIGASVVVLVIANAARVTVSPLRLVLAGVALGATLRGLTSYLLLRNANSYDAYRNWVLGSLSGIRLAQALALLPVVAAGVLIAAVSVRPLAALALGDDTAIALGHRPGRTRVLAALAVALLTGASVALTGPIAFAGLLAPFAARFIAGPRLGLQLVLSALAGAALLLVSDVVSRIVISPYELPVAVILALVGAPILVLIARSRGLLTLRAPGEGG